MKDQEVKLSIQSSIKSFASGNLTEQSIALFKTLGYNTERQNPFTQKTFAFFKESFLDGDSRFNENKALIKDWKSVDLLFQLTKDEVSDQKSLFAIKKVDNTIIETYLFFALELTKAEYTRTALAQVTREINKVFPMPVLLLFKYGEHLTLSVINRRLNKKDEQKDVLKKVTLIKDISIEKPHRAHIEILFDLSFEELKRVHKVSNFVELHNAWQKTLDSKELNNRFYRELSNWYFWAIKKVSFPNDVDNDKDNTVFNSESIIRLLTRLIFIWFIKEKNLIPEKIFEEKEVSKLIKGFNKEKSTVYYRAILQNLFFATLNQKIEEREFVTDGTFEQNKKNYGIKNLYRYASDFAISKAEVIKLFEGVPFLNGGLFDCLDSEDKNGKVMYLDGFSRNLKKQAQVPDELFFSQEKTIDLSGVYDDKKKKNETVKGLFEIFNQYKFTITENTPIEEEVALDPELLGRVFENLLASYNPETKTTARKKTGSFYTPREIVNYMVDESLKAYLKQKLETEAGMKAEDAEIGLKFLVGYNEKEHLFDNKQTEVLINAIDTCKILDPACGSGAFPMGILHKLVHILHKLDPQNKLWEERQIEKAMALDDSEIRDGLIADIETAFRNNELDYGRKLYLIENCIYGVDIQPIATQISKLRFFISLIVDQKADKTRDNFSIRPLPNLETKFVAANTLIEIEKPKVGSFKGSLFDNQKVKTLEEKLKDIRHRLFSAKTPATKRKLRTEDQNLREEIAELLVQNGWGNESALQLAAWDPYNQNANSSFFDPEWMFGITDGFDVVIGNPPYISGWKDQEGSLLKKYFKNNFHTAVGHYDYYVLFYEKGFRLLNKNGVISYITSNKWMSQSYGLELRKMFLGKRIIYMIDFKELQVFEATVDTQISLISNSNCSDNYEFNVLAYKENILDLRKLKFTKLNTLLFKLNDEFNFRTDISEEIIRTVDKIEKCSYTLEDLCYVSVGAICHSDKPKKIPKAFFIHEKQNKERSFKQYIEGKDIEKWGISSSKFLDYQPKLFNQGAGFLELFTSQKIVNKRTCGRKELEFVFDDNGYYTNEKVNNVILAKDLSGLDYRQTKKYITQERVKLSEQYSLLFILAILNSKVCNWYFRSLMSNGLDFYPSHLRMMPIPKLNQKTNQKIFVKKVKLINILYNLDKQRISFFEKILNAMVYELYFPDEIKAADAEVLKHLGNLPDVGSSDVMTTSRSLLQAIEKIYKELSAPDHPVSITIEKQKNVPEIRIIEGLDK